MSTTTKPAPSHGPTIIAIGITFGCLSTASIAVRCWTRARISKNFNFNDVFMIIAAAVFWGLVALLILAVNAGVGGHTIDAGITGVAESLKYIFFIEVVYVLLTSVMKASLAVTLLQWAQKKIHIWLLSAAIVIDAVICLVVFFYFMFECRPISYKWTAFDGKHRGKCLPLVSEVTIGYALSGTTISLDMLFLFVPFWMLRGRGVDKRLKLYIYGLFGLGVLASIANFCRLSSLVVLKTSLDPLYTAAPVFLWSTLEVNLGIIAAGLIELRPLFAKYNVKGFVNNNSFGQIEEDGRPIRMNSLDKQSIGMPHLTEVPTEQSYRNRV